MKRPVAVIVAAAMLILPARAFAEARNPLTYERAISFMNLNNGAVKKLRRAEEDALRQYESYAAQAKNIDTMGFSINFNGQEHYIYYDPETRLMMTKAKELVPEQMKFSWESAKDNRIITENAYKASLRGVLFSVYHAQNDMQLKQKQLALASEINRQDKIKHKSGMITDLNMQESDYNLLKAQKDADAAKRNYENALRNFNQFVGLPAKTQFTEVVLEEEPVRPDWQPVEFYIEQALSNRFEVISLKKQIDLKEQEKKIIESSYIYKVSTTAQEEYERLLNDLEQLELELKSMKLSIAEEIKNAYVDVLSAGKNVENAEKALKLQRSNYEKMRSRYSAGLISKNMLAQSEIGLVQSENGYIAVLFDYNTRIMRFNNAVGIGPGY